MRFLDARNHLVLPGPAVAGVVRFLALLAMACTFSISATAQHPSETRPASDLGVRNLDRVAASAEQIETILRQNAGLAVELKRWVAKEATDHGQIVQDSDLTDQAIFARLRSDSKFRGVATRLLQRYGYLIPKLNPESPAAREEQLLLEQRLRRLRDELREEAEAERRTRPDARAASHVRQAEVETTAAPTPAPAPLRGSTRTGFLNPLEGIERGPLSGSATSPMSLAGTAGAAPLLIERSEQAEQIEREAAAAELAEINRISTVVPKTPASRSTGSAAGGIPSATPAATGPNPFADIPSLYDLYRQLPARGAPLDRFGLEIFRHGTRDPQQLPMDLPVGPDYVIGPGDGLAVDLWGSVSQRLYRVVDREGRLALPEVGPVLVSGRSLGEVQSALERVLRTQYRDVSADVSLLRLRTIRVYVVGDVELPGAYDISSLSTPLNAFFAAGGPTERGSLRTLRHYRGQKLIQEVDVYDLLLRGIRSDLVRLENGDTVLVPPVGPQVAVEGAVRRPAIYEVKRESSLAELLELAGGILPTAALQRIEVERIEAHQKRTMFSLDLAGAESAEEVSRRLKEFVVRDGDEVRILPIAPHNRDAVYLTGHVLRPGRYTFREGMRVTDLLASYADLLPEPATRYAEIVRLHAPDFRPAVESFDLGAALANPQAAPLLHPLDTVRIFSRYDFEEPPTVWVGGEVWSPGSYRTSGQIHLRDAVYLAGGLTPDARGDYAQVVRRQPDSSLKVLSVNVADALAGDPIHNILLEPRDRILIHPNPARVDPAAVSLRGEVAKPGRYPLATNMRVSDLIRMGGGLKRSAFTDTADLTRFLSPDGRSQAVESREINIAAALAGDPQHDLVLRDGDTLAIRPIPGWADIGASVTLSGEVAHPGTYGIRPGERLSSVLRRAGGFLPTAFPQGAVLLREEVRELQERSKRELIERIEAEAGEVHVAVDTGAQELASLQQAALAQRKRVLESLRRAPVSGRMVVTLYSDLNRFEGSTDDIELRDGDRLIIPKQPDFVVVVGQVHNSNAIAYTPRKKARWYLSQAGGTTRLADRNAIFIIRANGSVISGGGSWWGGRSVTSVPILPGDTIVVPEQPLGESTVWKNTLAVAQVTTQAAISAAILMR